MKANTGARDEAVTIDPGRDAGTRPSRNREGQTLVLSLLTLSSGACSLTSWCYKIGIIAPTTWSYCVVHSNTHKIPGQDQDLVSCLGSVSGMDPSTFLRAPG